VVALVERRVWGHVAEKHFQLCLKAAANFLYVSDQCRQKSSTNQPSSFAKNQLLNAGLTYLKKRIKIQNF